MVVIGWFTKSASISLPEMKTTNDPCCTARSGKFRGAPYIIEAGGERPRDWGENNAIIQGETEVLHKTDPAHGVRSRSIQNGYGKKPGAGSTSPVEPSKRGEAIKNRGRSFSRPMAAIQRCDPSLQEQKKPVSGLC
jgi:hypothetical protein